MWTEGKRGVKGENKISGLSYQVMVPLAEVGRGGLDGGWITPGKQEAALDRLCVRHLMLDIQPKRTRRQLDILVELRRSERGIHTGEM